LTSANGGGTKLGLIGVDGITSGPPGGTLTFTGLDLLVLATVNGSINLTSDVSFQDLSELAMYARGASSTSRLIPRFPTLGFSSLMRKARFSLPIPARMTVGEFDATAGNNLTLQVGSLLLDGKVRLNTLVLPGTTVTTGANLTLNVTGDYTNSSALSLLILDVTNGGAHIGTGGNIDVSIGGDLTTTGSAVISRWSFIIQTVRSTWRQHHGYDGRECLYRGGLNLLVENYDETASPAGHIGTGGNLSLTTGETSPPTC